MRRGPEQRCPLVEGARMPRESGGDSQRWTAGIEAQLSALQVRHYSVALSADTMRTCATMQAGKREEYIGPLDAHAIA